MSTYNMSIAFQIIIMLLNGKQCNALKIIDVEMLDQKLVLSEKNYILKKGGTI